MDWGINMPYQSLMDLMSNDAAKQMQMYDAMQGTQLRALQMQQAQQSMNEDNQLKQLLPEIMQGGNVQESVSYTHLTLPTNREV